MRTAPPSGSKHGHRSEDPVPIHSGSATSMQPDLDDLADLDALAEELNRRGFPSLRLTPLGKLPYVDVSLPGEMDPGERIYAQAGTFFWADVRPIAPSDRPVTAAAIIAQVLQPHSSQQ
jgi:hypothetical protein